MMGLLAKMATVAVALFLALHGLMYLVGVALPWEVGEPGATSGDAVPTAGSVADLVANVLVLLLVAGSWLSARRAPSRLTRGASA